MTDIADAGSANSCKKNTASGNIPCDKIKNKKFKIVHKLSFFGRYSLISKELLL